MTCSIREASERFNISPYTLRYYEKEGLLPPICRTDSGARLYSEVDLEWLHLICCMRATGMSISYIRNYVDLCRLGKDTVPERRRIILNQKKILENEIKKYKDLLKVVNKKLAHYNDITRNEHKIMNL